MTHQLLRAAQKVRPWLLEQHPWLATIEFPENASFDEVAIWLAEQVAKYGEWLIVEPLPIE